MCYWSRRMIIQITGRMTLISQNAGTKTEFKVHKHNFEKEFSVK